jgi:hypothetical protein
MSRMERRAKVELFEQMRREYELIEPFRTRAMCAPTSAGHGKKSEMLDRPNHTKSLKAFRNGFVQSFKSR